MWSRSADAVDDLPVGPEHHRAAALLGPERAAILEALVKSDGGRAARIGELTESAIAERTGLDRARVEHHTDILDAIDAMGVSATTAGAEQRRGAGGTWTQGDYDRRVDATRDADATLRAWREAGEPGVQPARFLDDDLVQREVLLLLDGGARPDGGTSREWRQGPDGEPID